MTANRTEAQVFWDTHCSDCAHDLHPMNVCAAIVGGDQNGPDYCPCALDYPALAAAYNKTLLTDPVITYAALRGRIHERGVMDDELRAWLIDQSRQAHLLADHPDGQPGDPGGYFDKGAAHMADATLTWLSERRELALAAQAESVPA